MIKVIAKATVKEDKIEVFKKSVQKLVEETRKESGCIVYQLFQDVNNKNVLTFIEEWENLEALQKHMNSNHFKAAIPVLSALQEKDMEVSVSTLVI